LSRRAAFRTARWDERSEADARRIDEHLARLRIVEKGRHEHWRQRVRVEHHGLGVVRDNRLDDATEKHPRAVEPLADGLGGLSKRRPNELVAAVNKGDDERPEHALFATLVVDEQTHLAEVDLRLLTGRRIIDAHGRRLFSPLEFVMREAPERVVAGAQAVISNEQRVDLAQAQRARFAVATEPTLDERTVLRDLAPLATRGCDGTPARAARPRAPGRR